MDSSGEDSDASIVLSSQETQFVPQDGDDEILWTVIEITAETKKTYKVKWAGVDPATNKPWAQSWVPKHDCTNDLVVAWKLKKARQKQEAERKKAQKGKGKATATGVKSGSKRSTTNSTTTTTKGRSGRTTRDATSSHSSRPTTANPSTSRASSPIASKRPSPDTTRKRAAEISDDSPRVQDGPSGLHPRKKRKVDSDESFSDPGDVESGQLLQNDANDKFSDVDDIPKAKSKSLATRKPTSKASEGTPRSPAGQSGIRRVIAKKTATSQHPFHRQFLRTKPKKRLQRVPDEDPSSEEGELNSKQNAVKGKIESGHESDDPSRQTGNDPGASNYPGQSDELSNTFRSSPISKERATAATKATPLPTNPPGRAPTTAAKTAPPRSSKGHAITAKKTATLPTDRFGKARTAAAIKTTPSGVHSARPRKAPDDSSEGQVTEYKPAATTGKIKPPVYRRREPKGAGVQDALVTDHRLRSPDRSHGLSNLSPRTEARLVQFDHDLELLNDGRMRSSLPPIETLPPPDPSQQSQSDQPRLVNGRNNTKSSRSRAPASHSPRASKASASGTGPSQEVPSSTWDQSVVPETEPESSYPDSRGPFCTTRSPPPSPSRPRNHAQITASSPALAAASSFLSPSKVRSPKVAIRRQSSDPLPSPTLLHRDSRRISSSKKSKSLGRLPVISPSVFHQIAAAKPPPASSDVRIESVRGLDQNPYTPSPIEVFSSPEKDKRSRESYPSSSLTDPSMGSQLLPGARDVVTDRRRLTKKSLMKRKSLAELLETQKNLKLDQERQAARIASTSRATREPQPDAGKAVRLDDQIDVIRNAIVIPEAAEDSFDLTFDTAYDDSMTVDDTPGNVQNDIIPAHIQLRREEEETTQEALIHANGVVSEGMDIDMMSIDETRSQTDEPLVENADVIEASNTVAAPLDDNLAPEGASAEVNDTRGSVSISKEQDDNSAVSEDTGKANGHSAVEGNAEVAEGANTSPGASTPSSAFEELQRQLAALQETLDAETRARKSAESDRDFFREQYTQASSFVSSVRADNEELVQRADIAEKRATEGVRLVRATFAERVRVLETEVTKARAEVRLHVERDRRTGNDIRRRAAEEPELRARCVRLERKVEKLEFDKEALEMDMEELQTERENMLAELEVLKQLKVETDSDAAAESDGKMEFETGEPPAVSLTGETRDDDDVMVYRCQWRADGTEVCNWFFPDIEDLQRHMFIAGHIQDT